MERSTLLNGLRKRRQPLARVVLPFAVAAWLGCGATPCVAFPASVAGDDAARADAHSHHPGHGAPHDSAPADQAPCPHCASHGSDAVPQVECAVAAVPVKGPSFDTRFVTQPIEPASIWGWPRAAPRPTARPPPLPLESISLNLRYCVLVI